MTPKIKLRNSSGVPLVRFRGVHFDRHEQFTYDVADGVTQAVQQVPNGEISVTAFRNSDAHVLGTLTYGVSDTQGFAAILVPRDDPDHPYWLVGEAYVIDD
jgi:hypothetical protein